ncbi:hypothetical protein HYH03_010848 [Edaphochlamys debaryana]|uniref:rRNA adenine N(6)-methyltransferase n=1 Tax=Edaphochlamys debaryana TaxID=47281 RepID=A0A835XV30_9CHLO|nr:hypothetical protein HYH03_010848 [Edaphochlamys debaryana]|eukprot:KAG2490681.1 hypothetical protein HYH03_010848 [Edaphochlamys debaryana]
MPCPSPTWLRKGRSACPSVGTAPSHLVSRTSASRRPSGPPSGRRSFPATGPARQTRPPPAPGPRTDAPAEPEPEPVVPGVGWMWQPAAAPANGSGAPAMPSAASTVANLYQDRIRAKKSLGQNFMTDDSILRDLVVAAGVGPGDLVLEVGPGTGNLTKHLLAKGAHVTAVEKDDTLYGRLSEEYDGVSTLRLVRGDALEVGLEDVIRSMVEQDRTGPSPGPEAGPGAGQALAKAAAPEPSTSAPAGRGAVPAAGRKVKVVANLPYNITKDLLTMLLPLGDLISDLHIMIQHEAAERLCERTPGGPDWRAANIRTLFYCKPKYRFRISRFKYDPVPGVDGALVTFSLLPPHQRPPVPSERGFHELVLKAFSERRKKMRNSLQPLASAEQVQAALAACGLNVDARAQDLTLDQFVALSWRLHERQTAAGLRLLEGGGQGQGQGVGEQGPEKGKGKAEGGKGKGKGAAGGTSAKARRRAAATVEELGLGLGPGPEQAAEQE